MAEKTVLVLDCGATNIRTIAVNDRGSIVAVSSLSNNTRPDPVNPSFRIWDVEEIWRKFSHTTREVLEKIDGSEIAAITVTTFGVDGAPFDGEGRMIYPVISWQCPRTVPVMENIGKYIELNELYRITGLQPYAFNTINKLIWLRENEPEVVDRMEAFLFIPSIFLYFLTGEMVTDMTMAGTSMLTDLRKRSFSKTILNRIGLSERLFPVPTEPGNVIGTVKGRKASELGLPEGIPVVVAGHDTQFAIFGSGAEENEPVLSSGTWEILMVRTSRAQPGPELLQKGVTHELDVLPGLVNTGIQWIASGMLEWIRRNFYLPEKDRKDIYEIMIDEARQIEAGSKGVRIDPSFYGSGGGSITGLTMDTPRAAIYRAALESLVCKTKHSLNILEDAGGFQSRQLLLVGGGAKNRLWNQLRADILGIPVKVVKQKETTVLGAALFALAGTGLYASPEQARANVQYETEDYSPTEKDRKLYESLYERYLEIFESS